MGTTHETPIDHQRSRAKTMGTSKCRATTYATERPCTGAPGIPPSEFHCRWWFWNPKQPPFGWCQNPVNNGINYQHQPGMVLKPVVNNGRFQLPTYQPGKAGWKYHQFSTISWNHMRIQCRPIPEAPVRTLVTPANWAAKTSPQASSSTGSILICRPKTCAKKNKEKLAKRLHQFHWRTLTSCVYWIWKCLSDSFWAEILQSSTSNPSNNVTICMLQVNSQEFAMPNVQSWSL